ncbi:MAG: adenosylmethionine decarboxylase [Minisyncoccia bacterium]|jgi:S-adenosylmethionine decarboxylase
MFYGKHLLVEAIIKNQKDLTNKVLIKKMFEQIVKAVNITPVLDPVIYQFPKKPEAPKNLKGGITAFYIIAESHLSIHTWPEDNYFAFDFFSCTNFNEKKVIDIIEKTFEIKKFYQKVIDRGISVNFKNLKIYLKNKKN